MQSATLQFSSNKIGNWISISAINFLLILILFFATTNTLAGFSLDKLMFFFLPVAIGMFQPDAPLLKSREALLILLLITSTAISSVVNLTLTPMIFFPAIGLTFSYIIRKYPGIILYPLYYALIIHMICGLLLDIMAFRGIVTPYVSGYIKGFSFLFASRGLTTTPQTFGTLCLVWLLIYFLRKKLNLNKGIDKVYYVINAISVLSCLSRSTLIFWILILFFKDIKLFIAIFVFVFAFMIKFWEQIITFITSSGSLVSRNQLLEGFEISYLQSNSLPVYLFGRGTNQLSLEIAERVKWVTRLDFENGYTMLLHSYGAIGLTIYLIICGWFIYQFMRIGRWAEVAILSYYFFVTQYFTQEFVSVSFYFLLSVLFVSYDLYNHKLTKLTRN